MLVAPGLIVAPGAYDALSARIIARSGFGAVYLTGYGASASRLGVPDIGLLTLTEMVDQCRAVVAAAGGVPVIADADTGYGDALNVRRTVREYQSAGVAALQLEDQVFPKRCGHMEGKRVIDTAEMVSKLRAAADARTDPDLVIIARTDARAVLGFEAALERCRAYRDAGADVIFLEAPESREEMMAVAREIGTPLFANLIERGRTPLIPLDQLAAMGYKIAIYPLTALYAAARAVSDVMAELRARGTTAGWVDRMIAFDDFNELTGLAAYRDLERRYGAGQGR